ncbi:RNA-directed DNA polymerase, eukaryota [Tanacetum coccineum]
MEMRHKLCSVAVKLRDTSLISSFRRPPRGGIKEEMRLLGDIISSVVLSHSSDRWIWRLDSLGDFSVKSLRCYIDDSFLPKEEVPTRWIDSIPIKVNIFAWKVCLDKLPTRLNLSLRGLDIPLILCPICHVVVESTDHLLFSFDMACQLMRKVARWPLGENKDAASLNIGKNKESDVADEESESDLEEVYNETTIFMASKSGGGTGKKSLYKRWKDDYDDNPYDDDECEDFTEEQLALCDAFDIRLRSHVRR